MKIDNLKNSEVRQFKNYKTLCEYLGEEIKSGKSKRLQLEDWERYFEFHKEGNKIIIDSIYDEPIEKIDKRTEGNNSKFKDDISILILDLLAQSSDNELFLSTGALLNKLDMVNCNYASGRRYIAKLSEITEVPEQNIYDFYNYTQSKLKRNVESALKNLSKKSLIYWSTVMTVCYRNINVELNSLNEIKIKGIYNDKAYFETNLVHREATSEEIQLILRCEKETLKELNLVDKQQVFLSGQWNSFRNMVNDKLKSQGNIEYYYNSYKITYNHSDVLEELNEVKKFKTALELNGNIMLSLAESSVTRHDKATKEVLEYIKTYEEQKYDLSQITKLHASNTYLDFSEKLIDVTIYMLSENLNEKLRLPLSKDGKELISNEEAMSDLPF